MQKYQEFEKKRKHEKIRRPKDEFSEFLQIPSIHKKEYNSSFSMLPLDPADLLLRISFQDEEGRNILTKAGYLISRFFKENILISHVSKESLAWFGLVWFGLI